MLMIKPTPHLYGISLKGDYDDLQSLHESLSNYMEFYVENTKTWPYHEYEYMLSLNYDIRHAYMGTRNTEFMDNHFSNIGDITESIFEVPEEEKKRFRKTRKDASKGNLYYSVEILYPLVFHYLITLETILDDSLMLDETTKLQDYADKTYTLIDAQCDVARIRMFTALLWKSLEELFDIHMAHMLYNYFINEEYHLLQPSIYVDALLHWQLVNFDTMTESQKKDFYISALFELMGSDDLCDCCDSYKTENALYLHALQLTGTNKAPFPTQKTFFSALEKEIPDGEPLYENTFERFLNDHFGVLNDKMWEPEW